MRKILLTVTCIIAISGNLFSQQKDASRKETVYVPAYPSIFHGDSRREYRLTVTLSIHNIDMKNSISVDSVDYYSASGKLIKHYLTGKLILGPLETVNFTVRESDKQGGVGANFIVRWSSQFKVRDALVETIMIGTSGQQGISFTSRGVPAGD